MDRAVLRSLDAVEHKFEPAQSTHKPLKQAPQLETHESLPNGQLPNGTVPIRPAKQQKKKVAGAALIGIDVAKEEDFPAWYQQVLLKGDMIDYYDISGCYILKPYSWSVWETMSRWFDARIKTMGIRNCSFPMFVTEEILQKEKNHIEGFAAEVAWVTQSGKSTLEKKIAIRPTSETIMYPYFAKWIRSHRDLPLRLNQWNSVVRWEFKHPQPFLRSREFFWQEGHTAHLRKEGADQEVKEILNLYSQIYEDLLAVPVIQGRKTDKERFAGGLYTTSVEGYIPATGRGIQGATSHCLGQNFAKMFGITVEDPATTNGINGSKSKDLFVWQNSWAFSTRVIGVMVMIHSDNRGLVMPPRVAPIQVVIVPVGINVKTTQGERQSLLDAIQKIADGLIDAGVRVEIDQRDYSPGYKFNHWELMGVPIRIEFGPGELESGSVTISRRDLREKSQLQLSSLKADIPALLDTIHANLYNRARETFSSNVKIITEWTNFVPALDAKHICLIPFCLEEECEDKIKKMSSRASDTPGLEGDEVAASMGAKSLCIPFDQLSEIEGSGTGCLNPECSNLAKAWCLFGRSY